MAIQIRTTLDEPETGGNFVPHRPARPEKSEGGRPFKLVSDYEPSGDQPAAIAELVEATRAGESDQVLLGVTGSGTTFTMRSEEHTSELKSLMRISYAVFCLKKTNMHTKHK